MCVRRTYTHTYRQCQSPADAAYKYINPGLWAFLITEGVVNFKIDHIILCRSMVLTGVDKQSVQDCLKYAVIDVLFQQVHISLSENKMPKIPLSA